MQQIQRSTCTYMARVKDCFYLLLEDAKGLEQSNHVRQMKIPVTVKKGELVTPCREPVIVSKSHLTHNYRLSRDPSVTLYCMEQEIVVVNDYEFKLLEAIRIQKDRYKVYCNGLFEWGAKLKVKDKVMVKLPSKSRSGASLKFAGVVRYVGALTDNLGFWFGVKIKKEDYRDCDFSNSEQHYIYHDDKQHTVIVSLDKLRMLPTINNNGDVESVIDHQTETTTSDENTFAATQDEPHQLEEGSTNHSHTPHQVDNLTPPHQVDSYPDASLEVQSRVQVPSSVPGEEYQYGVIQWIGPFRNGKELFAGIELDDYMEGCTDGTWQQTGERYFECPNGKGIFYPLVNLKKEERFGKTGNTLSAVANSIMAGSSGGVELYRHILMKDVEGERVMGGAVNAARKFILGTEKREPVRILRGELIVPIVPQERGDGKPPHNYVLQRDQSVTFYSVEDNVSPLHYTDYKLLEAIESAGDRYTVFSQDNKLEWGSKLKEGDDVFVRLFSPHSNPVTAEWSHARVLYKGSVQSLPGIMFGVEIMDARYRGRGSTNGWFQKTQYFKCEEDCGFFVSLSKLTPKPLQATEASQQGSYYADTVRPLPGIGVDPPNQQDAPLALNDRVLVYNKQGVPYRGTVCWIGNKTKIRNLGALYVGIETDSQVYTVHFAGEIPAMSDLFRAKHRHHLVVPLSSVIRDNSSTTAQLTAQRSKIDPDGTASQEDHSEGTRDDVKLLQKQLSQSEKKEQESLWQQLSMLQEQLTQQRTESQQQIVQERAVAAEEKKRMINSHSQVEQQLHSQLRQKEIHLQELQQQLDSARAEGTKVQEENAMLQEQLTRQLTESQQQIETERAVAAEEKQRMINSHSEAEEQLHSQLRQQEIRLQELQQQLDSARAESGKAGYSSVQVPPEDQDFLNVSRDAVKITGEIGRGASGVVLKGRFRGQPVAVKQVHRALLQQYYTIPQMRREIQIMASVQHPNLVRFIAAVIDDKVDRGEDTPLLVVEMLDMDLRHAYKTTDLGTNNISIFRDVAYGLHYLHEHQEPIIHRDVSAPNVLLQCLQGGTYRAKLSDFGSANKAKDARTAGLGAICYTAPEAFPPVDVEAPVPPQTPKIDVYSYGILLAEVITRTMPTTENRRQLFHEVKRTWGLMYELICSCTKPTPSDRPTMASILNTLNRIS